MVLEAPDYVRSRFGWHWFTVGSVANRGMASTLAWLDPATPSQRVLAYLPMGPL